MLLANFNGKEHLRHRTVSLRQHGFLVLSLIYFCCSVFSSVLWYCWLGLLTCKTVSHITYIVLVGTLNPAQSINQSIMVYQDADITQTSLVFIAYKPYLSFALGFHASTLETATMIVSLLGCWWDWWKRTCCQHVVNGNERQPSSSVRQCNVPVDQLTTCLRFSHLCLLVVLLYFLPLIISAMAIAMSVRPSVSHVMV